MSKDTPSTSETNRKRDDDESATPFQIKKDNNTNYASAASANRVLKETAFDGKCQIYKILLYDKDSRYTSIEEIFDEVQDELANILQGVIIKREPVRARINVECYLIDYEYVTFNYDSKGCFETSQGIKHFLTTAKQKIVTKYEDDQTDNQQIKQFQYILLEVYNFNNVNDTELPNALKPYVSNIEPQGLNSFVLSILSALHPNIEPDEENLGPYVKEIIMKDGNCDVQLDDLPRIEEDNKFSVNVFMLQYSYSHKHDIIKGPVYHTKGRKANHINLLLLKDHNLNRYCHIKDLKRAMKRDEKSQNNSPEVGELICDGCANSYDDEKKLERHRTEDCLRVETTFPEEKSMKFVNTQNEDYVPFVVYADFEALSTDVNTPETDGFRQRDTYKKNIHKHIPHSYGYYIKCIKDDSLSVLKYYRGKDTMIHFNNNLVNDLKHQISRYLKNRSLEIKEVPIFVHNLKGYDSHFIMRAIDCNSVIGNLNNYFTIFDTFTNNNKTKCQLRYVDSMNFLKGSVADEVKKLDCRTGFNEIRKMCRTEADLPYLSRKGVFPYEYIKSMENLEERSLPLKYHFYSSVNGSEISDDDYELAMRVWRHFDCKTIGDYSDLYLQIDVLLLADAFENLRRVSMTNYGLDPAYYYSISGLSWDAMLKYTGVELELLVDVDMLTFIKKGIRGGVAHCSKRHAVANNKYLPQTYDKEKEDTYIMYYDANNLYGHSMSQPLPYGDFEWVDDKVDYKLPKDSPIGYILEVDLSYPVELHNSHSDLPFCPIKKSVPGVDNDRLIADLSPKQKYIIHYSYLALCEEHGLVVDKIHRVLKFNQKPWLKCYIDYNNKKRIRAKSKSDEDFYKLLNNSIFGYSFKNIENYSKIKICNSWDNASRCLWGPDYVRHTLCSEKKIAVLQRKINLHFKDPTYVGFCILDMSKAHMYKFHYNVMKPKFRDNLKLLYTDTDAFIYQINTYDYYDEIKGHLNDYFDTDNYEVDNQFQIEKLNKKKVGYFKDELKGAVVKEFIALRPKMYTVNAEGETIKKATGVPKHVTEKFHVTDYRNCLYRNESSYIDYYRIHAESHDVFTQKVKKKGLSPENPNRCVLDNLVDTLPWGHHRLNGG